MSEHEIDFDRTEVPTEYVGMVKRLRGFLNDTVEQNDLRGVEESTDLELFTALEDTWDEVNTAFEPVDLSFKTPKKTPWSVLRLGAVLHVLSSKGIGSARNTLSYNDSGGVSIQENDEYGRYVNLHNILVGEYRRRAQAAKRKLNMDGAYGGVDSEYSYT